MHHWYKTARQVRDEGRLVPGCLLRAGSVDDIRAKTLDTRYDVCSHLASVSFFVVSTTLHSSITAQFAKSVLKR